MGAQVQFNSYTPACYHMKDLNDDVRSAIWSRLYEDSKLNVGQYGNGFMHQNMDHYSEHEKEVLKQTMLKHEAIFRKQVSELHRLYQVQKDLMDDLRRRGMRNYSLGLETTQGGQNLCMFDDSQKSWQVSKKTMFSSSCSRRSTSDTDNLTFSHVFLKENDTQTVPQPSPSVGLKEEHELLKSKKKRCVRKSFDLQLPADVYIDIEYEELSVEEIKVQDPDIVPENEVMLTLGRGYKSNAKDDAHNPDKHLATGFHSPEMTESNGAHEGPLCKGITTLTCGIPGLFADGFQASQHYQTSSACTIPITIDHRSGNSPRLCLSLLESECGGSGGDRQFTKPVMGQQRSRDSALPQQYRNVRQFDLDKSLEVPPFLLPEHGQKKLHFTGKGLPRVSITKSNSAEVPSVRKSMNTSSHLPYNISSEAYLLEPTRRNPEKIPLPSAEICEGKYLSASRRPYQDFIHEVPQQNGFNLCKPEAYASYPSFTSLHFDKPKLGNAECSSYAEPEDTRLWKILKDFDSHDVQSNKTVSLSLALPNGFRDDDLPKCQTDLLSDKGEDGIQSSHFKSQLAGNMQTHKTAHTSYTAQKGKTLSGIFGHQPSSIGPEDQLKIKSETEALCERWAYGLGRSLSNSHAAFVQQEFASFSANKNGLAVLEVGMSNHLDLNEPFPPNLASDLINDCSEFEASKKHQLSGNMTTAENLKFQNIESQNRPEHASGFCDHEEFASGLHKGRTICLDDREHEPFHSYKMGLPGIRRGSSIDDKASKTQKKAVAHVSEGVPQENELNLEHRSIDKIQQIDMDLPSVSEVSLTPAVPMGLTKEIAFPGESNAVNYSVEATEAIVTIAAKVLMIISSVGQEKTDHIIYNQAEAEPDDSLKWFADVLCSDAVRFEDTVGSCGATSDDFAHSPSGKDYFEMMTLMLKETKMDGGYCNKLQPRQEEPKEPETGASPAHNQPCRRSRRGRRQRDFQREILPGLLSLSRHEVTEDMQTIVCLMRASGSSSQMALTRKNGSRNECTPKGKRSRCVAMEITSQAVLAVLQPSSDARVDETVGLKSFTWGKTTRRRQMQRSPTTTIPTSCITTKKS